MTTINNNSIQRAIIYCRVSTKEQAEEGSSLQTQERLCKEYASRNGLLVTEVFIEFGESAKTADRTELQRLFKYCSVKTNKVHTVIVYKLDRLSRNTDDYSYIRLLLKRYSVEIKSTSENFENTPAGRFMENIIATVAQFDNDMRAERSIGGMREAARDGRYVWKAPVGYINKKVDGKNTIVPTTLAPLIQETFAWVAKRTDPIETIRLAMGEKGLITSKGQPVARSYFYALLRNELYTGCIAKFGERYKGTFEPLISEDTFYAVQCVLNKKNPLAKRTSIIEDFPLTQIMKNKDGFRLYGSWSKGNRKYYPYYSFRYNGANIRKEVLEQRFCEYLDSFALKPKHILYLKKGIESYYKRDNLIKAKENKVIEDNITVLKEKRTYLLEQGYSQMLSRKSLEEEILQIEKSIAECSEDIIKFRSVEEVLKAVDMLSELFYTPSKMWLRLPYATKIKLQNALFPEKIIIQENGELTALIISKLLQLKGGAKVALTDCDYWASLIKELENLYISIQISC